MTSHANESLFFRSVVTLGTIQILRKQKGGWVGLAKCLRLLTRWVGGFGKILT